MHTSTVYVQIPLREGYLDARFGEPAVNLPVHVGYHRQTVRDLPDEDKKCAVQAAVTEQVENDAGRWLLQHPFILARQLEQDRHRRSRQWIAHHVRSSRPRLGVRFPRIEYRHLVERPVPQH